MALVGLEDLHVAIMTSEGVYETPKKLGPAVTVNITPNTNRTPIYGDNRTIGVIESMGEIELEISVTDLSKEDYALLLGKTINSDGVVVDSSKDRAPYVALGFKSEKSDGGNRYVWLYKGKFSLPEESSQSKTDSVEPVNHTLVGLFTSREDGKWRVWVDDNDLDIDPKVIENWFKAVYEEGQTHPED